MTKEQAELQLDITGCKVTLKDLTENFIAYNVAGPRKRMLARKIIDLVKTILRKEEELKRMKGRR